MKTIITGLLSKAYNMETGKIAELLKNGAELSEDEQNEILNTILEADTQRVENIKKSVDPKPFFQDGYKKANSELMSKFESDLKTKYGIDSDKTGSELVDAILAEKTKKTGGSGLSEEDIKKSVVYQNLESKWRTDFDKMKTDLEKEKSDVINGYAKEKTFSTIAQKAMQIFNGLNPVLPQNKTVADNQVSNFMRSLQGFDYEIQDDRVVIMKDGKVLQDQHGNTRSFDDLIKTEASGLFEFSSNNGGNGSGNGNGNGSGNGGGNSATKVPKSVDELEAIMNDKSISIDDRLNIQAEFEKAQTGV